MKLWFLTFVTTDPVKEDRTRIKGHQRTRRDHATELTQDYAEAIADIAMQRGECRVRDLSLRFAVSHVTVNRTVSRLKRDGYVDTEPYGPVRLTEKGQILAQFSRQRHAVVFEFLVALGVSEATAAIDSEGIEHHVSEETLHFMQQFVNRTRQLPPPTVGSVPTTMISHSVQERD